jgi:hypothetical protein
LLQCAHSTGAVSPRERREALREEGRCVMLLDVAPGTLLIGFVPLIVVVPLAVFWAWMFKDMMNNPHVPSIFRPYWLMAFILLNIPAAIYYYEAVYRDR